MIWDSFSICRTNCAIAACGPRAYMLRGFSQMSRGKMASESPEIVLCFSVLAHNSTPLWLLEFCLSIFVVSCSSLSEDSAEFRYVPLYIADQVVFRCFFYKNFTLLHSKFHTCKRLQLFLNTAKSLLDILGYSNVLKRQSFFLFRFMS